MGGFRNKPKILKGAFVEYGLSLPPLFVVFQFNPEQLSRTRSLSYSAPGEQSAVTASESGSETASVATGRRSNKTLRDLHRREYEGEDDLLAIQNRQTVTIEEETISFDIRLDASDDLNSGDPITEQFGILPRLSTLELMTHPKGDSVLGGLVDIIGGLGGDDGFSFTKKPNPPLNLFIWGHQRVLPVNLTSLNITETEFSARLNPVRATVSVDMTVIEGKNIPFTYSKVLKEAMSVLNLANIAEVANVVVPG